MTARIHKKIGVMLVLAWLLIAGVVSFLPALSQTTTYTIELYPIEDAYVDDAYPDTNFGASEILEMNYYDGLRKIVFFKFNLSGLPSDLPVSNVYLKVYFITSKSSVSYWIYESSNNWSELTITYNNKPSLSLIKKIDGSTGGWRQISAIELTNYVKQHLGGNVTIVLSMGCYNDPQKIYSTEYSDQTYWPRLIIEYAAYTTITQNITITETETVTNTITETVTETAMITTTLTDYVTETQTTTVTQTDTVYTTETAYMTSTVTTTQTITDVITETATTTITQTYTEWANETITVTTTMTPTVTETVEGNATLAEQSVDYQALADMVMPIVLIVGVIGTLLGLLLQSTSFRRGD